MNIDWYQPTASALMGLWEGFIAFIPNLIAALVIFLIGWLIAIGVGKVIAEVLKKLKFNKIFEGESWKEAMEKAGFKVDISNFIGMIFKWIIVIVFLVVAIEMFGHEFKQLGNFLNDVLAYLPNIIVAVIIFVVAVIISDIVEKIVVASVEKVKSGYAKLLGSVARWSILVIAIMAILTQLGIARSMIETLWSGIIYLIVIAGGIAFGLGGKDAATEAIQNIKKKIKD